MPNYNITIDSRFDPYSFEDYLKPLAILQEQHNQAADAYANYLAQSAGMEEALAANPDDINLLNQYNAYRQTLNNLADDLSKNGISRTTRRGAYQAKADYGNIAKMQEAIKQREALLNERRNLFAKDNTIIFDRPDDSFSIKSIMSGNTSYKPLSLQGVTNQVISQVQNFAKTAYDREPNPEIKKKYQYLLEEIKTGAMPSEIQEIVSGKEPTTEMGKQLKGIVENVINNSIASGNWDKSQQESIRDFANRGLWNAIGTKEVKWHQDLEAQEAAKRAAEKAADVVHAKFLSTNTLFAPETLDLEGNVNRQRSLAKLAMSIDDNGASTLKDKDIPLTGYINAADNFKNYLRSIGVDENEVIRMGGHMLGVLQPGTTKIKAKDKDEVERYRNYLNGYQDYINKGSVLMDAMQIHGLVDESAQNATFHNIESIAGANSPTMKIVTGSDDNGNLIFKTVDRKTFEDDMLNDKGKLKENTRFYLNPDASGKIIATMENSSGKLYAFDLTNKLQSNYSDLFAGEDSLKGIFDSRHAEYNKLKSAEIPENIQRILDKPKENRTAADKANLEEYYAKIIRAKVRANEAGELLYDNFYDILTLDQKATTQTNSIKRG